MPTRCLVIERHAWETGFKEEQLQIPKDAYDLFFGQPQDVDVAVYAAQGAAAPTRIAQAQVSAYTRSATYRINGIGELGGLPPVFVFLQERAVRGGASTYELWWEADLPLVAARLRGWDKAKDSQHGRGRLWTVVRGLAPRPLTW